MYRLKLGKLQMSNSKYETLLEAAAVAKRLRSTFPDVVVRIVEVKK
jgi:hypothetical protein